MTDKEIRDWLAASLRLRRKTQRFLADLLEISPGQVSKLLGKGLKKGEKPRKLGGAEMLKIARELGVDVPTRDELRYEADFGGVPVRGRLAEKAWTIPEGNISRAPQRVGAVLHSRYPVQDQSAYEVGQPGLPGRNFQIGDFLITVPFAKYRSIPQINDLIVLRRTRGKEESFALRKAVQEGKSIVLRAVLEGSIEDEKEEGEMYQLVIGAQQHFL